MADISKSTFDTTYVNAAGTFADNSTREISEGDMRQFADHIVDSALFYQDDYTYYIKGTTASGTDTYTIPETIPAAYTAGERFLVTFTNANTGAATLNRNSLGAKDLLSQSGAALTSGQIAAGSTHLVRYNGTNYRILTLDISGMINPMTTGGDIIYGGASGAPTRLANGNSGEVLTSSGGTGAPTWGALAGSTYTPTISNVTNTSALTAYSHNYMRIGSFVHVSGVCDFTVTAAVSTDVSLTLPVASNFANHYDAHGTGFSDGKDQGCILYADATSNLVFIHFVAKGTGAHTFRYEFTYRII